MPKIISIEGAKIKLGGDDGKVTTVPIAALTFPNPKVGDQVEVFKDGDNTIVNKVKAKPAASVKAKVSKKMLIIGAAVLGGIVLVVCGIVFLPGILDEDLRSPSSYPAFYANLKEEKEAFTKALQACNKAAESKLKSKGITTEYNWTDLDAVTKYVDDDDDSPYIYLSRVYPTGGDMAYKDNQRYYNCEANISGNSVNSVYILWDNKN